LAGEIEDVIVSAALVRRTEVTWRGTGQEVACELILPPLRLVVHFKGFEPELV
jgi:hypothetical protein